MPTYDFTCLSCGTDYERNVPVDIRDDLQPCPECQESTGKRLFNPKAVAFFLDYNPDLQHNPGNLKVTRAESERLGVDPALVNSSTKSVNYLLNEKRDKRQQKVNEFYSKRKPRKTIKERMIEKWPETKHQLEGPVGPTLANYLRGTLNPEA